MKKTSFAALVASTLLATTMVANADGTVKGQAKASAAAPAPVAAPAAPAAPAVTGRHNPSAELIARPGNRRSIFELDFMIPVFQMFDRMFFVDLRGQMDTKRNKEANLGFGYRQIMQNSFILGGYVYGDYRRTKRGNNFGQLTIGAEALSIGNIVDLRVNGYIAEKKKRRIAGSQRARYVGTGLVASAEYEQGMSGFDGEVGFRIPMPGLSNVETRVFAGGYHFSASGVKKVAGPRGRLEVRINDVINSGSRLTLGMEVSNDKVRKTNVFGHIGLRIPMQFMAGGKVPQGLARRLADYVVRDVDIVTNDARRDLDGKVKRGDTNADWKFVHIDPNAQAGGDGSVEKPFQAIPASANITAGDVVVLHKNGNSDLNITANTDISTKNHVWIVGERNELKVVDARDNTTYTVDRVSSNVLKLNNALAGVATFTANNATGIALTGFDHASTTGNNALLDSSNTTTAGTYTQNVSDIIATSDANLAGGVLRFTAAAAAGTVGFTANVSKLTHNAANNANARTISYGATAANSTMNLNTDNLKVTYAVGANQGMALESTVNNGGIIALKDTDSAYKNCSTAINIRAAQAAADRITAEINKATIDMDATGENGVAVRRASVAVATAPVVTVKNSIINNASAVANSAGILVGGQAGAANIYSVTVHSSDNNFNNTHADSSGVIVTGDTAAGSASVITVNSTKDIFKGTAGNGRAVGFIGAHANATTNTFVLAAKGMKTSGYTTALAITGDVTNLAANALSFDLSSGDNSIDAATNAINPTAAGWAANKLRINTGGGYAAYAAAAAAGQFKKPLA